ncbi:hypothetical protein FJZ31_10760 [Candidatus Poribacteria bacterium]|nr:hypothetical protein [Candidatus Poribacteria bacterium]
MPFITSGPIMVPKSPLYIKRSEDNELLRRIRQPEGGMPEYITLLGAHQTGATSLLYMLKSELKDEYIPIYINLSIAEKVSEQNWYQFVSEEISRLLVEDLSKEPVSSIGQFYSFLRKIGGRIAQAGKKTVIMFDEIDTIPTEISDGFFGRIRAIYNQRIEPEFENYIFIFSGATDPREFISEENPSSPFNISKIIYTSDFDRDGVGKLLKNLGEIDEETIECVYGWTHGHPNLTQKVAAILESWQRKPISCQDIDKAVEKILTRGDDNLLHIRNKLGANDQAMEYASRIFAGERIKFNRTNRAIAALELIGLIRESEKGECVFRNRIYKRMFEDFGQSDTKLSLTMLEYEEDIRKSVFITLSQYGAMSLEKLIETVSKNVDAGRIPGIVEFLRKKRYIEETDGKLAASDLGRLRYE